MQIVYSIGAKSCVLEGGIVANRGEPVEVSDELGAALIARGDMFELYKTKKKRPAAEKEEVTNGN